MEKFQFLRHLLFVVCKCFQVSSVSIWKNDLHIFATASSTTLQMHLSITGLHNQLCNTFIQIISSNVFILQEFIRDQGKLIFSKDGRLGPNILLCEERVCYIRKISGNYRHLTKMPLKIKAKYTNSTLFVIYPLSIPGLRRWPVSVCLTLRQRELAIYNC